MREVCEAIKADYNGLTNCQASTFCLSTKVPRHSAKSDIGTVAHLATYAILHTHVECMQCLHV